MYPTRSGKPVEDLAAADFEILEDGVAQKVDTFEHVVVRPAGPQSERIEPSSQREMLQAAENPRNRVFVIFLDQTHVDFGSSYAIAEPLIRLINRILGPDDLVGVMTADMSANELVLSRRTEVTEERLRTHWHWGDRFAHMNDEREDAYETCYPACEYGDLAARLIARKREREVLEALQDLVRYVGGIKEERKAILTVITPLLDFPDELIDKLFAVNVIGPLRLARLAARHMAEHGGGSILNIASRSAFAPEPQLGPTSATKAALVTLSKAMALEWADLGVRVNTIAPGPFATEMVAGLFEQDDYRTAMLGSMAQHRIADPDEIVGAALFLTGPDASFITGAVLSVDGGMLPWFAVSWRPVSVLYADGRRQNWHQRGRWGHSAISGMP